MLPVSEQQTPAGKLILVRDRHRLMAWLVARDGTILRELPVHVCPGADLPAYLMETKR